MHFIEELKWRGMLHDMTPGAASALEQEMHTAYIGFDPTAPSLTIGNYVQLMLLSLWQKAGHKPIFLLGGATGRIGDPSGKDKERSLLSYDELDKNLAFQREQASKFLDFDTSATNGALMLNNHDFYRDMNVLDFLRDVGKNLTVNYMLSKESVKNRLASGLSFTEFSYQLLQAYDFLYLYQNYNCRFQMGGSDQWGNITSGTEFIRRNIPGSKAYAITSPLLTKSDGKKFGKSEEGNIWLDPKLTSPYKFYQFWINAADADLPTFFRYFSFRDKHEIESLEEEFKEDPRSLKKLLAEELTVRIHSNQAYLSAMDVSDILFNKNASHEKVLSLSIDSLMAIKNEIQSFVITRDKIDSGMSILHLLSEVTSICSSKSDARRAIQNNAIAINKIKVRDLDFDVSAVEILHGEYLLLENGRKNKFLIQFI